MEAVRIIIKYQTQSAWVDLNDKQEEIERELLKRSDKF